MATVEPPEPAAVATSVGRKPGRVNVETYDRMAESGLIPPDARVELIDGEIVTMCPINSEHHGCVVFLTNWAVRTFGARALTACQGPVRLDDYNEPEPDLAVIRPRSDHYRTSHPAPADVFFLIEVMNTSAAYDRGVKLGLYARSGIPEVWLVDLNAERVDVYRRPEGNVYREITVHQRGQSVAPQAFPDATLTVDQILG